MSNLHTASARPLADGVTVITGLTPGIGLATAHALAGQGCAVMLNGFSEAAEIAPLCALMPTENGVQVEHANADLADADQAAGLVPLVVQRLGRSTRWRA